MKTIVLGLGVLLALSLHNAHAQKTYKWVDEQGNVTYQDHPPPENVELLDQYEQSSATGEPDGEPQSSTQSQSSVRRPVILYSVAICDACDLTRNLLTTNGIQFVEKDVDSDIQLQKELKALIGQLTVPVLAVGEQVVSGYSRTALSDALTAGGYELDGNAQSNQSTQALTPEQVQDRANQAAEELIADTDTTDGLRDSSGDALEEAEEIPEDERIQIPTY